jgi:hypothetical protein
MEDDTSDSAEEFSANACQGCGSRDVQHRSYSRIEDEQGGKLVLLCEDCHRERFGP